MESNRLRQIIKEIQYKTDLTIEEIAKVAGYTRVHITKELKKESSPKVEARLLEAFQGILQNDAKNESLSINENPGEQDRDKDKIIELQSEVIRLLKEKEQLISNLSEIAKALARIEGSLADAKTGESTLASQNETKEVQKLATIAEYGSNVRKGKHK